MLTTGTLSANGSSSSAARVQDRSCVNVSYLLANTNDAMEVTRHTELVVERMVPLDDQAHQQVT